MSCSHPPTTLFCRTKEIHSANTNTPCADISTEIEHTPFSINIKLSLFPQPITQSPNPEPDIFAPLIVDCWHKYATSLFNKGLLTPNSSINPCCLFMISPQAVILPARNNCIAC